METERRKRKRKEREHESKERMHPQTANYQLCRLEKWTKLKGEGVGSFGIKN